MPIPIVTGISPKEGPPGTKITIRGENFGNNAKDLIALRICLVDCLLSADWISSNKIIARSGLCKGKGDIIVVTLSGGVGESTVQFRGLSETIDPLHESAIWVDESKLVPPVGYPKNQPLAKMETSTNLDDPLALLKESEKMKTFPAEDLQELYPESSGSMVLDNFSSIWFLLEHHHSNSFRELKSGFENLKKSMGQKNEGPYSFIKTNLMTFLGCLDALENLDCKMETDTKGGLSSALPLNKVLDKFDIEINQCNDKANWLFSDIFGNKAKADSTRNALGLINRFKLLFNLPQSIGKWIGKGEYSMAINDYNRAKSLYFVNNQANLSDIPVFKKVFELSEAKMEELKNTLRNKLFDYPCSLENQKQILKLLYEIDPKTDYCMESITKMTSWLTVLLLDCKDRYLKICRSYKSTTRDDFNEFSFPKTVSNAVHSTRSDILALRGLHGMNGQFTTRTNLPVNAKSLPSLIGAYQSLSEEKSYPLHEFVTEFCYTMSHGFYDIWTLGQSFFSGHLTFSREATTDKTFKIDPNKFSNFKKLINNLCTLYCGILRGVFIPKTLSDYKGASGGVSPYKQISSENLETQEVSPEYNNLRYGDWSETFKIDAEFCYWITPIIAAIRECQVTILKKCDAKEICREDIAGSVARLPQDSENVLKNTVTDLRLFAIISILKLMEREMRHLCLKENWKILKQENGYGCTKIAGYFVQLLESKCELLHALIQPIETENSTNLEAPIFATNRTNQKEVTFNCTKALLAFGEALQYLSFGNVKWREPGQAAATNYKSSNLNDLPSNSKDVKPDQSNKAAQHDYDNRVRDDTFLISTLHISKIKTDKRLLYCLSNLEFVLHNIVKKNALIEILVDNDIPQPENIRKKLTYSFYELSEQLFQSYSSKISKPVTESIQSNINSLSFDWRDCPEPNDVKSYARILIQNCIEIYTEINSISPALTVRVMSKLVENIFQKLLETFEKSNLNNDKSLLQAKLDVSCLEIVLNPYLTGDSKDLLNKIYALFSGLHDSPFYNDYKRRLQILQDSFKKRSFMDIECLKSAIKTQQQGTTTIIQL